MTSPTRSYPVESANPIALKGRAQLERGTKGKVAIFWDDKPGEDVRVIASIDDGGWRAFAPLSDSFILSKTAKFVGE